MAAPTNTSVPTIGAQNVIGETVTSTDGTWTGSPTFAYQWQRAHVAYEFGHPVYEEGELVIDGWENIASATSSTYLLAAADYQCLIRLKVTGTNGDGSAIAYSAESGIVIAGAVVDGTGGESLYRSFASTFGGVSLDDDD